MHVEKANRTTIYPIIEKHVGKGSSVYTDDHKVYDSLHGAFDHESVKHSAGECVKGKASTNSVERFWALIKRAYYGTHHWWSYKHLHRYVAEYGYLISLASMLFGALINNSEGKSLSYHQLINSSHGS